MPWTAVSFELVVPLIATPKLLVSNLLALLWYSSTAPSGIQIIEFSPDLALIFKLLEPLPSIKKKPVPLCKRYDPLPSW